MAIVSRLADPDIGVSSATVASDTGMKVDPRQIFTLEAFSIGSIILSAMVLAALMF